MIARWRLCQWCNAAALKSKVWCKRHGPGRAEDRRRFTVEAIAKQKRSGLTLQEVWAERGMPPEVLRWAPVARIRQLPKRERPVGLFEVSTALQSFAAGGVEVWSDLLAKLADTGLLVPGDAPLGR